MHAAFITLVDHSFVAAARQGLAARNDSEQVLKLDPEYADAKMAVGIQQFAVASLPRILRLMIGIAGVSGSKEKGLDLLRDCAAHGVVNNIECRTALSLFLRHDGRYAEALAVQRGLAEQYPRDYLFRLEEANLTKDEGNGPAAISAYRRVLDDASKPGYFINPRLQLAYFGLADTQRGQNDIASAAQNYMQAAAQPNCSDWLRKRAQLNAGQMSICCIDGTSAIASIPACQFRWWRPDTGSRSTRVHQITVHRQVNCVWQNGKFGSVRVCFAPTAVNNLVQEQTSVQPVAQRLESIQERRTSKVRDAGQSQPGSAGIPPHYGAQGDWTTSTGAPTQRLIRPKSPRILGGVCAAFALHFGWELQLVRIVTAVFALFYGIGILAYIACWIIIPEAQYAPPIPEQIVCRILCRRNGLRDRGRGRFDMRMRCCAATGQPC